MHLVIPVTLILFFITGPIQRIQGFAGANRISRVMGSVLASVAVDNILKGFSTYFALS